MLRFNDLQLQQKAGLIVVGLVFVLLDWNGIELDFMSLLVKAEHLKQGGV